MDELILQSLVVGDLSVNCYIVRDQRTNQAFVIDCPGPADQLKEYLAKHKLKVDFFIITHGHYDHISGLDEFTQPVYVSQNDSEFLVNAQYNGSAYFDQPLEIKRDFTCFSQDTDLSFANSPIEIISTPGHTPGGISVLYKNWVFTGDALFYRSVGRTDFPLASHDVLISAIKKNLLTLPDKTIVCPGHGPKSTIAAEKNHNPFLV